MTAKEYLDQLSHEGRWTPRDQQMIIALSLAPWWTTVQIAWAFFPSDRPLVLARRRLQKLEQAGILVSRRWPLPGSGGPPSKGWSVVPAIAEALGMQTMDSAGDASDWAWAQCLTMEYTFQRFRRKVDVRFGLRPVELGAAADLVTVRLARNGLMHAHYWTYLLIPGRTAYQDPDRLLEDLRQFRGYAVRCYRKCELPGECRWVVHGETVGPPWRADPAVSYQQWNHWLHMVRWPLRAARWTPGWNDLAYWPLPLDDRRGPANSEELSAPSMGCSPLPVPARVWTSYELAGQDCGIAISKRQHAHPRHWTRQWRAGYPVRMQWPQPPGSGTGATQRWRVFVSD